MEKKYLKLVVALFLLCLVKSQSTQNWSDLTKILDRFIRHSSKLNTKQQVVNKSPVSQNGIVPPTPVLLTQPYPEFGTPLPITATPIAKPSNQIIKPALLAETVSTGTSLTPQLTTEPPFHRVPEYENNIVFKSIDNAFRSQFPVQVGNNAVVLNFERQILPKVTKFRVTYKNGNKITYWISALEFGKNPDFNRLNTPNLPSAINSSEKVTSDMQNPTSAAWKVLLNFSNNANFKKVDEYVRSVYPTILQKARVSSVSVKDQGILIYSITYHSPPSAVIIQVQSQPATNTIKINSFRIDDEKTLIN